MRNGRQAKKEVKVQKVIKLASYNNFELIIIIFAVRKAQGHRDFRNEVGYKRNVEMFICEFEK